MVLIMRSLTLSTTILASYLISTTTAQQKQCYGLNGSTLDSNYAPCDPNATHSACCSTNNTSPDICLSSGLCMGTHDSFMGVMAQMGCTDPTGLAAGCPLANMCPDAHNDFKQGKRVKGWSIMTCENGSYCCRDIENGGANCCNNATAPTFQTNSIGAFTFKLNSSLPTTTTSSASTTPSPTSVFGTAVSTGTPFTAGSPSASSSAAPAFSDCSSEKKKTAAVGGALGGVFGAIILGLLAAMLYLYKKEKHQRKMKEHYEAQFEVSHAYWPRPATMVFADANRSMETVVKDENNVIETSGVAKNS